jgi:WD40 repeat protein
MLFKKLTTRTELLLAFAAAVVAAGALLQGVGAAQQPGGPQPAPAQKAPAGQKGEPTPAVLKTRGAVWRMAWSGGGKTLITASFTRDDIGEVEVNGVKQKGKVENTTLELWDTAGRKLRQSLGEEKNVHVESLACSADGKVAAVGLTNHANPDVSKYEVRLIDLATGALRTVEELEGLPVVVLSPDGKTLACAGEVRGLPGDPFIRLIRFWDMAMEKMTGDIKEELEFAQFNGRSGIDSLAYTPDGKMLATANADGTIALWDTRTRKRRQTLESEVGPGEFVVGLAFSPDGKALAIAGSQQTLKLFDTGTGKAKHTFDGVKSPLLSLAFSPDGKLLATGLGEGECVLWEVQSGAQKRTLRDLKGPVTGVAFSPDGRTLATGVAKLAKGEDHEGGEVRLWALAGLLE